MSEHDDRIEQLVQTVPTIQRTRIQQVLRALSALAAVVAFVALTVAIVGFVQTADLANCTNDNLGVRNLPSVRDREAQDVLNSADLVLGQALSQASDSEAAALLALASPDKGVRLQAFHEIVAAQQAIASAESINVTAHHVYQQTRAADDKIRDANPIGKC
jgi:hypothetical protein